MKAIVLFALLIFSSATFAGEIVSKIQAVLPFGYFQGEYCSVFLGSGFGGNGVSVQINRSVNGNLFSTSMSIFEDSPWTEILKDNSEIGSIDIKAKNNLGNVQRLMILDNLITIQLFDGRRVRSETSCLIIN